MGVIRSAGWRVDKDTDKERFIVVVEYAGGDDLPNFPIAAIWKEHQVDVVLKNPDEK